MSRSSGSEHLGGWELRVFYRIPVNLFLGLLARSFRLRRAPASKRKGYSSESVKAWTKREREKEKKESKDKAKETNETKEIYANIFLSKS